MATIREIYEVIDRIAPIETMDKTDNSGMLVGNYDDEVTRALIALDITNEVVQEAKNRGAQLILSHHPVFNFKYEPFNTIGIQTPIYNLAYNKIAAICVHTPLDMAKNGINDMIFDLLRSPFSLREECEILEHVTDKLGYGKITETTAIITPDEMAGKLKSIFNCTVVRYCVGQRPIRRIAFCSGGSGSLVRLAAEKNVDAYICGDVKHDQWIFAKNNGISMFDCGHYHTEVIMTNYLKNILSDNIQGVEFILSEKGTDPVLYAM